MVRGRSAVRSGLPTGPASGSLPPRDDRRLVYGALILVTLLGAILRVSYLDQTMLGDEGKISIWAESWSAWRIVSDYHDVGNHILHTFTVWMTRALFGNDPWSVRLPSLIAGIALIPLTFLTASALFSTRVALISAGLVAGSPYLTLLSINARGYSLQALLVLCLLWILIRHADNPSYRTTVWAGVVGALGLYTLPTTTLVLPGLYLGVALRAGVGQGLPRQRDVFRTLVPPVLITGALAGVLYLPVFIVTGFEALAANPFTVAQTAGGMWERFEDGIYFAVRHMAWESPMAIKALCGGVVVIGLYGLARQRSVSALVVGLVILSTFAGALLLQRVPPDRGFTFLLPFCFMLLAAGIHVIILDWVPDRAPWLAPPLAVLVAASGMFWTWSSGHIEARRINGVEAAMHALAMVMTPRDIAVPVRWRYRYYVERDDLPVHLEWRRESLDGIDNIYVLVPFRGTSSETLDARLSQRVDRHLSRAALDVFGEPELFRSFPDLYVFRISRR